VLDYLTSYRSYAASALSYYQSALYYLGYLRAYQQQLDELDKLLNDPRVKPADRSRLQSAAGDAKVLIDSYQQAYRASVLSLLQYAGISPGDAFVLEEPRLDAPSRYYERTLTPQGQEALLAEAYENNPQFRVLQDAIEDSELKRTQALQGRYDLTAFAEGTQFGFGSETYDDRVRGWQANAGVTLRLNDQRVLTASQKKAEAETRAQIVENIEKNRAQFRERSKSYLSGDSVTLTIDDVLTSLSLWTNAECQLVGNVYYGALAENRLITATGEVYRLVGMRMVDNGNGVEIAVQE
jgi:hypothetical protein